MTLQQQILTLIIMLGNGIVIGIIFDGYRVLKSKIVLPKITILFIDTSFGIISALLSFYLLMWSNNGQLRIIILLAFILGIMLYYFTISHYVIKLWLRFYKIIYRIFKVLIMILNLFIVKPVRYLYKSFLIVFSAMAIIFSFIYNLIKRVTNKLKSSAKNRKRVDGKKKKEGYLFKLKKLFIK